MASPTPQDVRTYLAAGLTCSHLEVEGDGRHFFATIVSAQFEGLSRVRRHQLVYAALGDRMREEIPAGRAESAGTGCAALRMAASVGP